jgi:hypothetical protein
LVETGHSTPPPIDDHVIPTIIGGIAMHHLNPKSHMPWNKGKITGQKAPLKLREILATRIRLQMDNHPRNLALFNLAIDSKLRACDLVSLKVSDVAHGSSIVHRAIIMQRKIQKVCAI